MKTVIAILLCFVFTFSLVGCENSIPNTDKSNDIKSNDSSETDNIDFNSPSRYLVDIDSLTFESSMENAKGEAIDIYTDSIHRYYVFRETNELSVLSLSDEMMESLEQKYLDNPDALISNDAAEQCLRETVMQYFPEYDESKLKFDLNDETENCLEYYAYIVYEYDGINRVNTASISIAFDGTVSLVTGSHNSPEIFNGSDVYSDSQIKEIVYSYMLKEKDTLALEIYPEDEYYDENGLMPQYQLCISTPEDMKDFSLEKIVYDGKPCWQAEFTLVSSWAEFDGFYDITNPVFHVNVDAIIGEVVSCIHT